MKSINHILDTALKISDQAAELIRMSSQRIKSFKSKGEISNLVTQTDIETDKLISGTIKEIFPDHNIISEELGGNNNNSNLVSENKSSLPNENLNQDSSDLDDEIPF